MISPVGRPVQASTHGPAEGFSGDRLSGHAAWAGYAMAPGSLPRRPVAGGTHDASLRSAARSIRLRPNPLLRFSGADGGNTFGEGNLKALSGRRGVIEPLDLLARQACADGTLDGAEGVLFIRRDKGVRIARGVHPSCAPDPVDVILGELRDVEIYDEAQRLHVDAAGGDVCCDEDAASTPLEAGQGVGPLRLTAVTVNPFAGDAVLVEEVGQPVGPVLGSGEGEDMFGRAGPHQFQEEGGLQLMRDRVGHMGDPRRRRGLALDVQRDRVLEHVPGKFHDGCRQGRRKEQGLPFLGDVLQDAADVRQKTHVEHAVRLVEHKVLNAGEACVRVLEMIEEPTGGRNQDVNASAKRLFLGSHGDAPVDRGAFQGSMRCELAEVIRDLRRQLPGGRQNERPRRSPGLLHKTMKDG